jgi:hypothetical protein
MLGERVKRWVSHCVVSEGYRGIGWKEDFGIVKGDAITNLVMIPNTRPLLFGHIK